MTDQKTVVLLADFVKKAKDDDSRLLHETPEEEKARLERARPWGRPFGRD